MAMKFRNAIAPTESLQSNCIMNSSRVQPVGLAQQGERLPYKQNVVGSSPTSDILYQSSSVVEQRNHTP